jgi:hypothetical protein
LATMVAHLRCKYPNITERIVQSLRTRRIPSAVRVDLRVPIAHGSREHATTAAAPAERRWANDLFGPQPHAADALPGTSGAADGPDMPAMQHEVQRVRAPEDGQAEPAEIEPDGLCDETGTVTARADDTRSAGEAWLAEGAAKPQSSMIPENSGLRPVGDGISEISRTARASYARRARTLVFNRAPHRRAGHGPTPESPPCAWAKPPDPGLGCRKGRGCQ